MKYISLLLSLLLCLPIAAQQTYRGRVVDGETGEALPYVSIYISKNNVALANENGEFEVEVEQGDTLCLSCVGYASLQIPASQFQQVIQMTPLSQMLHEVVVAPITAKQILKKVRARINAEYKDFKMKESVYFFRTTYGRAAPLMLEGFIAARNFMNLRDLFILSGKKTYDMSEREGIERKLKSTNIHKLLGVGAMTYNAPFWKSTPKPLNDLKQYKCSYITLNDSIGHPVYKISVSHKSKEEDGAQQKNIYGVLFVDGETYQLLRFDGTVHGLCLNGILIKIDVRIEYRHNNHFTEVSYIALSGTKSGTLFHTTVFNLGPYKRAVGDGSRIKNNLLSAMDKTGFDPSLWEHYQIILRTEEERIIAQEEREKNE